MSPELTPPFDELRPFDEHNRTLLRETHPPDWVNPVPDGLYNLVVIGGGTAGLVTAAGAAGLGAKVALVERRLLGGDCLNVGCVPSKALLRSARSAFDFGRAAEFGVSTGDVRIDFAAVMERMRRLRAANSPHDSARRFRELGIDVHFGDARFTGKRTLEVAGQALAFARACVATGAKARVPDIPGLRDAGFFTNETIFSLTALPPRMAVIGGGPIGCELAQAFARLGSRVTLVTDSDRLLPRDDPEASALVNASLRRDGVAVMCGARVVRVDADGPVTDRYARPVDSRSSPADSNDDAAKVELAADSGPVTRRLEIEVAGASQDVVVDAILVAVGRMPNVDSLRLDMAGIRYDIRRGVEVNQFLQTTNRAVYAAGDVAGGMMFTHAADAMARIVIQNALFFGRARWDERLVPWCTFTDPEVAHVGWDAQAVARSGSDAREIRIPLSAVDRATLDGETEGFLRVFAERKGNGRILGATLVARHAGDIISEVTAAMRCGAGLKDLAATIHPYPTQAEIVRKAGDAWNRARLTPRVQRWLTRFLAWRR